eukprot:TRINITY_DN1156_c0_g1_i1.p1 TRINITY_DN1156_c0_g1~~TRINITY_DN1156_c0_g1_i1.p1  ORF type:complete len:1501 (+),score=364.96 TRINITY_DN1156_c0_g1_i1:1403-5905(+)
MPTPPSDTAQQSSAEQLSQTVHRLRADLAKHKRRLDKAARKETELETLLLNSEGDIEALRARLTACQIERDHQRDQSHKYEASLKQQHRAQLDELKQANAQLRSRLDQSPSVQQLHSLQEAMREKVQQLETLSKQSHAVAELQTTYVAQIKEKNDLLFHAREQLEASQHQLAQYEKQLATAVSQSKQEALHFESLFAEKDTLFDDLKHQLSAAEEERQALQTKLQRTASELQNRPSVENHKSLQQDLLRSTDDLRTVHQLLSDMQDKHKKKELQLQRSEDALDKIRQDMSNVSDEAESLRCKGHQQAQQIEEQQQAIENSRQLLEKAQSQANSINDEFEKSSQAFRTERDALLTKLEGANALINQRPQPEQYQAVLTELENSRHTAEKLQAQLTKALEDVDSSKHTSEQQLSLIKERESSVHDLEQQLSHARDQMMAMKSQFESQLNISVAEKTQLNNRLLMVEEQLHRRPKEEECLELKTALESNIASLNSLQAEKEKLNGDLNLLRADHGRQQMELNEKHNLLVEAKNGLIECEQRIKAQESRHEADLKRYEHTLSEKDDFISELKSQLQGYQEQLSDTTTAFEKEREQLQLSLSEARERAALELRGFEESRDNLNGELNSLKAQMKNAKNELAQLQTKLEAAENTLSQKDSALASLHTSEEKLRDDTKQLCAKVAKLKEKLRESDRLVDEASKTSERVVQIQTDVHKKEIAQLRAEISSAKSARDFSVTLLRRVVQRVKQVCVFGTGNQEIQSIEIDKIRSVSELQILANNMIVSIEEHLQNRAHLQSEVQELESREVDMKKMLSLLETEKKSLANAVAEAKKIEVERDVEIDALKKKAKELEKLAVSYKLFSEESETRLQNQEEAAEVTLTSLSEELKIKEHEYEHLLVSYKTAEEKVEELCDRLKEKEDLERKMSEMKQTHIEEQMNASLQREKLEHEKIELTEKLEQTLKDTADTQQSHEDLGRKMAEMKQMHIEEQMGASLLREKLEHEKIELTEKLEHTLKDFTMAQQSLEAMAQTEARLQSKCESLESECDTIMAARSSIETKNHELEMQLRDMDVKIRSITSTLEENASLHVEATTLSETRLKELETLRVELMNVKESKTGLEGQLSESSMELEAVQEALGRSNEELANCQKKLEAQSTELVDVSKEILRLQGSLQSVTEEKSVLEEGAEQLQKELQLSNIERKDAAAQIAKLKESLESSEERGKSLLESVSQLEAEIEELRAVNTCQTNAISSERNDIAIKVAELKESLASSEKRGKLLRESVSRLEAELDELRTANTSHTEAISLLEGNLKSKEVKVEVSSAKNSELLERVSNLELDIRNSALLFKEEKESLRVTLSQECDMRLRQKQSELENIETHLREAREKCSHLEKEKEKLALSAANSQDSQVELSGLQRAHEKLLTKVVKLQRRARRAEQLLKHEKKKHAVVAKRLDAESKRQVSPSTKGLSPAMKRPRAQSLRPPLSPRDGNSRPPLMPKAQHARRSLDFGA